MEILNTKKNNMESITVDQLIQKLQALKHAIAVTVKISHREEMKVVARDLIRKRNSASVKPETKKAFDVILRAYYIDEDEWQDYVIDEKPII